MLPCSTQAFASWPMLLFRLIMTSVDSSSDNFNSTAQIKEIISQYNLVNAM